jgi:hypothetical protein
VRRFAMIAARDFHPDAAAVRGERLGGLDQSAAHALTACFLGDDQGHDAAPRAGPLEERAHVNGDEAQHCSPEIGREGRARRVVVPGLESRSRRRAVLDVAELAEQSVDRFSVGADQWPDPHGAPQVTGKSKYVSGYGSSFSV